jgi:CIC family chloride channel protein
LSLARLSLATLLVGVLSGFSAIGFHFLADRLGEALFAEGRNRLPFVVLIPTVGLGLIGVILQRFPEGARGGVKEVHESITRHAGVIPVIRALNVVLSGLVLAFGGSVGPEGPMVQIGALVGSRVGLLFGLAGPKLNTMVRAGAAAGIGSAFRSPAGGVLLTLEVFGARFDSNLAAISIAAVAGYVTRVTLLGDGHPFRPAFTPGALPLLCLVAVAPVMGLAGALTGHAFITLLDRMRAAFPAAWPLWTRVTLGGVLVGGIGIWYPQVMSSGYPAIRDALAGRMDTALLAVLLALKVVATSITFGSGAVGGLFAPTLVMGAMFGGAFGFGLHALAPELAPQPELFVLLGMIVMFASIVKGYWSGLLMVADMSGCYEALLLPGVVAGGVAYLLAWKLKDRSVFGLPIDTAAFD